MKNKVIGLILALVVILSSVGGFALADVEKGTLQVSFMPGIIRIAVNILAQQLGYFAEEGVTVQEVNLGGMDALTAINGDGNLDVLTTGFVPDLQAIGNGYDLVVIGGTAVEGGAVIAKEGNADAFRDAGTIINVDAFLNAKLGFKRNEAAWVITRQYLLDNGVTAEQIAAIEDEAAGAVRLGQPLLDDADDDAVGHQLALVHVGLGLQAHGAAVADGGPEHVAGGDGGDIQLTAEDIRLCPLARTGGAQKDKLHGRSPYSRKPL